MYRASSIQLFIDALKRYLKYLQPLRKKDNEKIEQLYTEAVRLGKYLIMQKKKARDDWDIIDLVFEGRALVLIKSLLYYEKVFSNRESDKKLYGGQPLEAVEFLKKRVAKITELENLGQMGDVSIEKIMGDVEPFVDKRSNGDPMVLDEAMSRNIRKLSDDQETNDRAVDDAATILEDRIRSTAGLPMSDFGTRLVKKAFDKNDGLLILSREANEQDGYHKLYEGFLSALKNPLSHRRVKISSDRAKQVIQFADYLVGLLDSAERRVVSVETVRERDQETKN